MKRTSMILLSAGALVAAITGTALAGGNRDATPTQSTSSAPTVPGTSTEMPTPDATADVTVSPTASATAGPTVSSGRAGEIALAHVGGGTITEIESEVEHGRTAWSVKILKNGSRYKVYVDRSNGEITRAEGSSDDDGADDRNTGDDDKGRSSSDDNGRGDDDRAGSDDHGGHHSDDEADDRSGGSDD
ncbi:PepSY domain-containing protein [Streptomyces sp. NPDC060223]|uniref:PepSY domain-containing protein n=1 Tax=unclassified Streptomyces TaxID=2593676 RepID=UPI0036340813